LAAYRNHGIDAEIDDEMIPVIDALNALGLRTISCCSGHEVAQAQLAFCSDNCAIILTHGVVSINWDRPK